MLEVEAEVCIVCLLCNTGFTCLRLKTLDSEADLMSLAFVGLARV